MIKKFRRALLSSFLCGALASASYAAEVVKPVSGFTPQLSYSADLSLVYIDKLANPVARSESVNSLETLSLASGMAVPRALGLGRFALGVDLTLPEESKLHILLRPDVLNRSEDYSDHDTRTGSTYFQQSKVKFVDEYYISFEYDLNLDLSFGVFEKLSPRYAAFTPLLDFGLEVRFPERFSAARIGWQQTKGLGSEPQDERQDRGLFADIFILQGNEDRAEVESSDESTQDTAAVSEDAHLGIAGTLGYNFSDRHRFGVLLGIGKNDYSQEVDQNGAVIEQAGKRDEVYGQIFDSYLLKLPRFSTKFSIDYRIMKEKWKSDFFVIQPRTHQSLMFSLSNQVLENVWAYTGVSYGRSKMHDDLVVDGYQMDFGLSFNPKKNLYVSTAVAEEHRDNKLDGATEGAYFIDGKESSMIRRFALELRYLFSKG